MPLTEKDIDALRTLLQEEIRIQLAPIHTKLDEVFNNSDALFLTDEKREQEYLLIREQQSRLHQRVDRLEGEPA